MKFLLDTDTCVGIFRGRAPKTRAKLDSIDGDDIRLCSVVRYELMFGAERSNNPPSERLKIQERWDTFDSLPSNDAAASAAGVIRADLERRGLRIGPYETLIAAIAKNSGLTVVTRNISEFGRVSGLQVVDWEAA